MAKRKALGRGLGAYFPNMNEDKIDGKQSNAEISDHSSTRGPQSNIAIPGIPDAKSRVHTIARIPISDIRANPFQPRTEFVQSELEELASSIREHGIIQPLTVRYLGEDRFELISGERRLRAAKMAELEAIPGYIIDADNEQMMAIALIENIQRSDLNAIEVALGYQRLIEECNYTQEVLAAKVGKNRSTVTNMLRLLQLPAGIQRALIKGEISVGHARALLSVERVANQEKALKKIVSESLSVRQTEVLVKQMNEKSVRPTSTDLLQRSQQNDPFIEDVSKKLRDHFATKIDIKKKKKGGELRINFDSEDDLQRVLDIIGI